MRKNSYITFSLGCYKKWIYFLCGYVYLVRENVKFKKTFKTL